MSENNGDLIKGLFIGGLIGVALGLLFAPKSGKETREDITRRANDLLAKAKEEYEKAAEKSKMVYESVRGKASEAGDKVGEITGRGVDVVQNNKNKFKKAIEAGLEAYREESSKE